MKKLKKVWMLQNTNKVTSDDIVLANMEMLLGKETNPKTNKTMRLSDSPQFLIKFHTRDDDCEENDNYICCLMKGMTIKLKYKRHNCI